MPAEKHTMLPNVAKDKVGLSPIISDNRGTAHAEMTSIPRPTAIFRTFI